ncbi:hypothetical protein Syun_030943 [Stephania yunnanensis]|uniref:Protein kinase domain-containing protein n=1 Tax=Stephania yunnanensis TaxID=152371 RepID=A0AAP0HEX3_9MAGN
MYAYGVLLLEMFTEKGRRDEEFEDGLDLHQFCKIALHKGVMKIIDPHVLEHEEEEEEEANDDHRDIHVNNSEIQRSTRHESGKTEECITSIIKVGVDCSMPSASERMGIKDALKKLVAAKKFSLSPYIGNLSFLHTIDLGNNSFRGEIPSSEVLGRLFRLRVFELGNNSFTGSLPYDLGNLSSLQLISLGRNFLEGGIPDSIGQLKSLYILSLDENMLSSKLPPSIYNLSSLRILDLTLDRIVDRLPSDIGRTFLPNLRGLFIGGNHFFGPLPSSLFNISTLEMLELSWNGFTGKVPDNMGNMQNLQVLGLSANKQLGSSGHADDLKFLSSINSTVLRIIRASHCQLSGILHKSLANVSFTQLEVAIGVIVSTTVVAALLSVRCWVMRRTKSGTDETQKTSLYDHYERVSFLELHRATDGFSPANSIGTGHFGSVFKAIIREGTEPVAVKVLNMIDHKASKSFMAECEALRNFGEVVASKVRTDDERYLTENLSRSRRLNIAIDVASALNYLHNQCETPIVHCDLKPSNILLDEDMVAQIGDFGLAKFLQGKNSNSSSTNNTSSFSPRGTIGYIPPGKRPTDEEFEDGLDLHQFCKIALHKGVMKIIDPHVLEHEEEEEEEANDDHRDIHVNNSEIRRSTRHESGKTEECITSIIKVGVDCSMPSASERMGIKDALKKLVAAKKLYESAR